MRLKSRGLGRKELAMDFREYDVVREDDEVTIVGTIRDPVNWDFTIRVCQDDIPGMAKLMLRRPILGLLLRWLFGRGVKHHWTQDRDEHVAEGKKRLIAAREKAEARRIAYEEALANIRACEASEAESLDTGASPRLDPATPRA